MASPLGPNYSTEEEDEYKTRKEEATLEETLMEDLEDDYEAPTGEEKIKTIVKRRTMPRMEETKVKPLNRLTPTIIGGLFDRVEFLENRINELKKSIESREKLNDDVLTDIDVDIMEKEKMQSQITDMDEKRSIKLDISILRKEKRQERVQFWRDVLELKTELRELLEQHETEKKILNIFKGVNLQAIKE